MWLVATRFAPKDCLHAVRTRLYNLRGADAIRQVVQCILVEGAPFIEAGIAVTTTSVRNMFDAGYGRVLARCAAGGQR
jgi:hypothetical protein